MYIQKHINNLRLLSAFSIKQRKLRPCLVISHQMGQDILCQITSKKISPDSFTVELKKDRTQQGTLNIDSYIRANMIFTAYAQQIVKKICVADDETYNKVIDTIVKVIKK
ncbi:MAG TPA: type II toxin-antitoxin system PemK/MazF family toxin [Candidatus Nanoarchaeia archaeon]|nr:type II toxin-antitoxin system PemK/MazF family toxin [Candidatus Nanoarchaeia archaeon]